jgi:hypothetical protein
MMGGEDFAAYGRAGVPSFLYFLGTQPPALIARAETEDEQVLPSLHSDRFAPVMEPTIKTGVLTMSLAVLNLAGRQTTHVVTAPSGPLGGHAARSRTAVVAARKGAPAGASQVR